jgi:ERO1-like protein alpha
MFQERLGNEGVKHRVENLYFTYLFVLRAIIKAGPLLASVEYNTGMPEQDAHTLELVKALVRRPHS